MKTTIQVSREVKKMLDELKLHPREPYESVIKRLIEDKLDEEPLSKDTLKKIKEALKDLETGKVYTTEEARKKLGI